MNAIAPQPETAIQVALEDLVDSRFQKERVSKRGNLDELAASMRDVGVLEPLIVRTLTKEGFFELVCGHRRKRAAAIAGLEFVPCIVREYSDDQVLEVAAVENGQRADVHPLDEADLFAELVHRGRTVAAIADKVGRSPAYVAQRVQLQHLCEQARAALDEEAINLGVALQLARLPTEKLQLEALDEVAARKDIDGGVLEAPMSAAFARHQIRDRFMLRLADAPFDTASVELVPKAGPCTTCPKRTGNQAELFADVDSPDLCTDPACHRSKVDAQWKLTAAAAKRGGASVLADSEAKQVFSKWGGDRVDNKKWSALDASYYDHDQRRTVSVAKLMKGVEPTLARNPHTGNIVKLVPKSAVEKAKRAAEATSKAKAKAGVRQQKQKLSAAEQAKIEREKSKAAVRETVLERCLAQVGDKAEAKGAKVEGLLLGLVLEYIIIGDLEGIERALRRRGVDSKQGGYQAATLAARKWWATAKVDAKRALLVEAMLVSELRHVMPDEEKRLAETCKALGVDRAAIEKQAIADLKAAPAPVDDAKPKPKGKR